ncbi:MAG: class I SAM-dependent methyltransferase [Gammaproteobacteria bacterium]|nr:class I SAM-dependent methyltransferase [Gammaproteobacteria bacterium]MDH5735337.1 class I SAM-dependent methyltransferase [Gammaproteobacteria bacterium]
MWEERYGAEEYAYGKQPNDFLVECIDKIPKGKVLCIADGEGRNAVYLAEHGCDVTSVDASTAGMRKAEQLARERNVTIKTIVEDLADFEIQSSSWDAIISIFCHLPPDLRKKVHKNIITGLRPEGVLILEAYTPEQIELGTGGPKDVDLTMTLESLKTELYGLNFSHATEKKRDVIEGIYHTGCGAVVQLVAVK